MKAKALLVATAGGEIQILIDNGNQQSGDCSRQDKHAVEEGGFPLGRYDRRTKAQRLERSLTHHRNDRRHTVLVKRKAHLYQI